MEPNILEFEGNLEYLFPLDDQYVFLVGAGISMNPPSNLPSAREICRTLLVYFAPNIEIDKILNAKSLRYEMLVELIQVFFDEKLIFMSYFDNIKTPNIIHEFLALALLKKNYILPQILIIL